MEERMERATVVREREQVELEEDDVMLPGFRFHPTDEELVGFYLRRKVAKKPLSIEIIREIDIYKYDPWDLPNVKNAGERELFFFCLRGRKYRNSIRPNRVTGSGFWKATGIDKPIYSAAAAAAGGSSNSADCIGLKKSLVYYRGSAGKGTKTEWMMHEFRLPSCSGKMAAAPVGNEINAAASEAWTICRIFKRNSTYKKQATNAWRSSNNKQINGNNTNSADNCYSSINSSITTANTTATSFANSSNSSSPSNCQEQEEQNQLVYCNSMIQSPISTVQYPDYLIQSPSMDELFFSGGNNCSWETELGGIMDYFMAD